MLVCGKILVNICASQSVDNNKLMNHLLLITYVIIVERILKVCNLPNPLPIFVPYIGNVEKWQIW